MNDIEAVHEVVRAIHDAWRNDRLDELEQRLRADVVYVAPGFAGRLEGKAACIASYREFLDGAAINEYVAEEPRIDVFDGAAVATYRFEIDYSMGGARFREAGHDLFVFVRDDDGWRAAWRTLIMLPGGT